MAKEIKEKVRAAELQLVIFRLANEEFAVPIAQVREIIRIQNITPVPKAPIYLEGVINLRGQIIAVMDLAKRFGLEVPGRSEKARIVVSEAHGNTVGLIVDEVPEVLRLPEDQVEPTPEMLQTQVHAEFIRGVGKYGDRLLVLLDMDKIISSQEAREVQEIAGKDEK